MGAVYHEMDSIEKSLEAFNLSIALYKNAERYADNAIIYLNMANLLSDKNELTKAEKYYDSSLVICKQYNIEIGIILNDINRGRLYAKMEKHQQALIYLKSSLEKVKKFNLIDYESSIDLLLVDSYKALGNTKEAFLHLENYNRIKDSTSGIEVKKQIAELQTKYNKAEQEAEILLLNEKLLSEKAKNRLMIIMILIGGIVLLIILFIMILQKRRSFYKNSMIKKEHEHIKLKLELKNKELITNSIHLASLREYSHKLGISLKDILDQEELDKQLLNELLNQFNNGQPKEAWTDFETRFEQLHEAFFEKLYNAYPDLSPAEIKICSFLRLNLTTKDIALLTHRSHRTIENQRNSIRKKMNLSSDSNLESYLLKI